MRTSIFLIGIAALFSPTALVADDCPCWTPSVEQIAAVEAKINGRPMPLGALDRYARYYAGTIFGKGARFIQGHLIPLRSDETSSVHIVGGAMPPLQGEGCIVSARFDTQFMRFWCARPGAWTPSDAQIADLEKMWGPDRQGTARYYAGVTEDGRQIIVGTLLKEYFPEKSGIHVMSEAEIPWTSDGGCAVVNFKYDPLSKEISQHCNGIR